MPFNIRVFALGQKYDVEPLQIFARQRFNHLAQKDPTGDGFSRAVKLFYEETVAAGSHEKELREDVVKYAKEHFKTLVNRDSGFQTVLNEVDNFAADVATIMKDGADKLYNCRGCGRDVSMTLPSDLNTIYCPRCNNGYARSSWQAWSIGGN